MNSDPERKKSQPPIPWWAWVFAAACAIAPFLAIGAITGAIGGGAAAGCVVAARNPKLPANSRIAICVAIVVACWSLVIAIVGGLELLRR